MIFYTINQPFYQHLRCMSMLMDPSLAPFRQVLRKLWPFKPRHSRVLLPSHCCPKALSLSIAALKLPYLLAHTSDWGVLWHFRVRTHKPFIAHSLTFVTPSLCGWEAFTPPGALPTLGSLGPLTNGATSSWCHPGVPLVPMVFRALLMERCPTYVHLLEPLYACSLCFSSTYALESGVETNGDMKSVREPSFLVHLLWLRGWANCRWWPGTTSGRSFG